MLYVNQEIGQRIAEFRKSRKLTQEQLGGKLGVSAQAVSKWEKGESLPDICLLPDISKELGLSIDALLSIPATDSQNRLLERLSDSMIKWDLDFMWNVWRTMFTGPASNQHGVYSEGINSVITNEKIAIMDGLGFGAIFTEDYLSKLKEIDIDEFVKLIALIGDRDSIEILINLHPMKRISQEELEKTLNIPANELENKLFKLMSYRFVMVDEVGFSLNTETWPSLLLMISGAFLWSGTKKRARSFYHNYNLEEK